MPNKTKRLKNTYSINIAKIKENSSKICHNGIKKI
jgi:hypothetical protein